MKRLTGVGIGAKVKEALPFSEDEKKQTLESRTVGRLITESSVGYNGFPYWKKLLPSKWTERSTLT